MNLKLIKTVRQIDHHFIILTQIWTRSIEIEMKISRHPNEIENHCFVVETNERKVNLMKIKETKSNSPKFCKDCDWIFNFRQRVMVLLFKWNYAARLNLVKTEGLSNNLITKIIFLIQTNFNKPIDSHEVWSIFIQQFNKKRKKQKKIKK